MARTIGAGDAFTNTTALGYNATVQASNEIRIGNSAINEIGGWATWTDVSDARFKKDIKPNVPDSDFIRQLRPVTYHMDVEAIAAHLQEDYERDDSGNMVYIAPDEATVKARADKSAVLNTGFIAQEVEAAAKNIEFDFYGVNPPSNGDDTYGLRYAIFTVPLVKAVQELSQENENLKSILSGQAEVLGQYKEELQALRSEIELIKQKLQN
ncbi:MAG: tail fiber domain-containing protein [Saprospiraceae bacterium]|nr:tail fiber domain-containing protein [Candidatus Opimibacter skivensis]